MGPQTSTISSYQKPPKDALSDLETLGACHASLRCNCLHGTSCIAPASVPRPVHLRCLKRPKLFHPSRSASVKCTHSNLCTTQDMYIYHVYIMYVCVYIVHLPMCMCYVSICINVHIYVCMRYALCAGRVLEHIIQCYNNSYSNLQYISIFCLCGHSGAYPPVQQ